MDVWSEMAKEVRQNFGTNGVKTVPKTNTDSSGSGNGDPNCGIKVFVPDGMERTVEAEHISQNINGKVKMHISNTQLPLVSKTDAFSSPQESEEGKNFSTESNSSGVQSNSYSDLSENGGVIPTGIENSSPEVMHKNLLRHITRGQCKGDVQNTPITALPQYPPPNYDSLSGNVLTHLTYPSTTYSHSKTSINTLFNPDHTCTRPASTHSYSYAPSSRQQKFSTDSVTRELSDLPLPLSINETTTDIPTSKSYKLHGAKQSHVYTYQPVSGKVQIQRSTYNLRQSSNPPEVSIKSSNGSTEELNHVSIVTGGRLRYGNNPTSHS